MNIASRSLTLPDGALMVQFQLDNEPVTATAGISVAAALLARTGDPTRRTAKGNGRTAFCMMGVCFDCLVEIDGVPNVQACMMTVQDGMSVKRQIGIRRLNGDNDV